MGVHEREEAAAERRLGGPHYEPEPPAGGYIGISDDGDECLIRRFDSRQKAIEGEQEFIRGSGGNVGLKYMPTEVAFYSPELLELVVARYRRLRQLADQDDKHAGARQNELARICAVLDAIGEAAVNETLGDSLESCRNQRPLLEDRKPRRLSDDELGGRAVLEAAGLEPVDGWDDDRAPARTRCLQCDNDIETGGCRCEQPVAVDKPTDEEVIDAMCGLGGGFVSRLGEAWMRADLDNRRRLRAAFPHYWDEYSKAAAERKARDAKGGVA